MFRLLILFPDMKLVSDKQDLEMMAGSAIPSSINLPEEITLLIHFKGKIRSFETTLGMSSSYGNANLVATIDSLNHFSGNMQLVDFDMGSLLKNKTMYGPVSMTAQVNGQGLDAKTMKAQIKVDVSQIYLNNYVYHNLLVDGAVRGREFTGKINLNDKNAVMDFNGL